MSNSKIQSTFPTKEGNGELSSKNHQDNLISRKPVSQANNLYDQKQDLEQKYHKLINQDKKLYRQLNQQQRLNQISDLSKMNIKNEKQRDINSSDIDVKNPLQNKQKGISLKNSFPTVPIGQFQSEHNLNINSNFKDQINTPRNQDRTPEVNNDDQRHTNINLNLKRQNMQLKNKNHLLKKQLQIFSQKLDQQIKRRIQKEKQSKNRKYNKTLDPNLVQSMELQNAYKKMQIYKRQILILKSKRTDFDDDKQNQYENKIKYLYQEIASLKQQIKTTKKIMKTQQKGLVQVGASGYFKVNEENERHKDQIRKLKSHIDQLQRKFRMNTNFSVNNAHTKGDKIQTNSQYRSVKDSNGKNNNADKRSETNQKIPSSRNIRKSNVRNVSLRIKTQSNIGAIQQNSNNNSSELQNKMLKCQQKIRILTAQKSRQRQIIQNLKMQVLQKDKEIISQKQKIQSLRKITRQRPKVQKINFIQEKQSNKIGKQKNDQSLSRDKYVQEQINLQNSQIKQRQVPKGIDKNTERLRQVEDRQQSLAKLINNKRYPRLDQKGFKSQTTFKWNHYQFSSKMKQIQILPNKHGFIKDIHVRYQKGQPKNQTVSSTSYSQQKYSSFVCEQGEQFIKQIKGGFKNGYLQYLSIKTNYNRKAKFCKYDIEQQCDNFDFNIQEQEFPCALYGENDNQGVRRLGCFIDNLKISTNNIEN